ncbi:MAG: class II glutamine amidotransferase [Pseudomonadota bacterium]
MCRWLVWQGEPLFLDELVFAPSHSLVAQALLSREAKMDTNADGFGLGWYAHKPEPCIYRDTLPAWADENLKNLAAHVRAQSFFAHVRASTGTGTFRANCHPFSWGPWLFMHNGQIGGYERLRRTLEAGLNDACYDARDGTSDSELLFLLAVGFGLVRAPIPALKAALELARQSATAKGINQPLRFTSALTDGSDLYAIRWSSDAHPPSLYYRQTPKGVVIVSEPLDDHASNWVPVPANHVLLVKGGGVHSITPFDLTASVAA